MGLLGGTKIAVSSVAFNLAGDYANIPNYLKSLVVGNVVVNSGSVPMGELIQQGYMNSPGVKMRRFYNWAAIPGNYNSVGTPTSF